MDRTDSAPGKSALATLHSFSSSHFIHFIMILISPRKPLGTRYGRGESSCINPCPAGSVASKTDQYLCVCVYIDIYTERGISGTPSSKPWANNLLQHIWAHSTAETRSHLQRCRFIICANPGGALAPAELLASSFWPHFWHWEASAKAEESEENNPLLWPEKIFLLFWVRPWLGAQGERKKKEILFTDRML